MTKLIFTKRAPRKGSTVRTIDVSYADGRPFGQLWTFRNTRTTWNPWHAAPLATGEHRTFWNPTQTGGDLKAAKAWMESQA